MVAVRPQNLPQHINCLNKFLTDIGIFDFLNILLDNTGGQQFFNLDLSCKILFHLFHSQITLFFLYNTAGDEHLALLIGREVFCNRPIALLHNLPEKLNRSAFDMIFCQSGPSV